MNVRAIYIEHNESRARYYVQLRNELRPSEITQNLYDTLTEILEPYLGVGCAYDCQYFNEEYTRTVDETHADFLAGTGRI